MEVFTYVIVKLIGYNVGLLSLLSQRFIDHQGFGFMYGYTV